MAPPPGPAGPPLVVVIGGGPSGIVAVKTLQENGFAAVCFEASPKEMFGGTFTTKAYDDARLVSSRFITPFSDFRITDDIDHPSLPDYVEYLRRYSDHFGVWPSIKFGHKVTSVQNLAEPGPDGNGADGRAPISKGAWRVSFVDDKGAPGTVTCSAVCVCSGLHNLPRSPKIPGLERFKGQVLHSSEYKDREMLKGQRVAVVGCGETGLDLTYRAVIAPAKEVSLVIRRGFLSVPTEGAGNGVPLDTMITNLFESSYVHPWLESLKWRWRFTTHAIRYGFWFATGSAVGFNQWAGGLPYDDVQRGHHIINKSTKAMPWINRPVKRESFLGRWVFSWADRWQSKDPSFTTTEDDGRPDVVCVRSSLERIEDDGETVVFEDGTKRKFDVILFATGYRQKFPFLFHHSTGAAAPPPPSCGGASCGQNGGGGCTVPCAGAGSSVYVAEQDPTDVDDPLPNEHNICSTDQPTLGFLGFVRPNVGAIPPMSEMQLFWWIQRLKGAIPGAGPATWHLIGGHCPRTAAYSCDYGLYMHDLARDIGAIPDIFKWSLKSWRVCAGYALGQAYVGYFRLDGPFATKQAQHIAATELWDPVYNRALGANILFVGLACVFGTISASFWATEQALNACKRLLRLALPTAI